MVASRIRRPVRWALAAVAWLAAAGTCLAQGPPVHYRNVGDLPPGMVGQRQLQRGGPLPGYFQPVEITAPAGARIAPAVGGGFLEPEPAPLLAGLLIGSAYRFRVTNIPLNEGIEIFPTVEVVDRLYPPPGQAARFPIPIELTHDELELAIEGRYVVRVIYLEDPRGAVPHASHPRKQDYHEVAADRDLFHEADRLGRPMAILRIGSRQPPEGGPDPAFLFGSPPLVKLAPPGDGDPAGGLEPPLSGVGDSALRRLPLIGPVVPAGRFPPPEGLRR
jgi:hypothetical protein